MVRGLFSLVIVGLAISATACADAPSSSSSTQSSPSASTKVYAVGQAMTDDAHQTVTVTSYQPNVPAPDAYTSPSAGNRCIAVQVALFNGDSTPWTLPLSTIAVVDANGQVHEYYSALGQCPTSSSIDSLVTNGKANASLYFAIPQAGALALRWTPSMLNANSFYETKLQ